MQGRSYSHLKLYKSTQTIKETVYVLEEIKDLKFQWRSILSLSGAFGVNIPNFTQFIERFTRIYYFLLFTLSPSELTAWDYFATRMDSVLTAIVVAIAHVFIFHFFSLRYKSDDLCIACVTRDNRYVIIHRRGTEQEKQTLVSDAGGAIFTGRCSSVSTFVFVWCNDNVQTMDMKMMTNWNCLISNFYVSMHISWIRSIVLEVQGLFQEWQYCSKILKALSISFSFPHSELHGKLYHCQWESPWLLDWSPCRTLLWFRHPDWTRTDGWKWSNQLWSTLLGKGKSMCSTRQNEKTSIC